MFRPVPKNLLLPWIAGQIGVALPLFALVQWWHGVLARTVFVDPARLPGWSEALNPFTSAPVPLFSHPLFWFQWGVAWLGGAFWLNERRRAGSRSPNWTLPASILLGLVLLAPLTGTLAIATEFGAPLLIFVATVCLVLQPAFVLRYICRHRPVSRRRASSARRMTVAAPLLIVLLLAGISPVLVFNERKIPVRTRLRVLLTQVDVHARDGSGETLLHAMVRQNEAEAVTTLLARGADPDERDARDETPLFRVGLRTDPEVGDSVRQLVSAGADVNASNLRRETALHQAVQTDNTPFIWELLANGADPNLRNREGRTPLHLAVRHRNAEVATYLVHWKADPGAIDLQGDTPARYARRTGNRALMEAVHAEVAPAEAAGAGDDLKRYWPPKPETVGAEAEAAVPAGSRNRWPRASFY